MGGLASGRLSGSENEEHDQTTIMRILKWDNHLSPLWCWQIRPDTESLFARGLEAAAAEIGEEGESP